MARVHQGIGGQTPEQAWSGSGLPAVKIVRARDPQPGILVSRRTFEDDSHLPVIDRVASGSFNKATRPGIEVEWAEAA